MSAHTSIASRGAAESLSPIGGFDPHFFAEHVQKRVSSTSKGHAPPRVVRLDGTTFDLPSPSPFAFVTKEEKPSFESFANQRQKNDAQNVLNAANALAIERGELPVSAAKIRVLSDKTVADNQILSELYSRPPVGQRLQINPQENPESSEDSAEALEALVELVAGHGLASVGKNMLGEEAMSDNSMDKSKSNQRNSSPQPN